MLKYTVDLLLCKQELQFGPTLPPAVPRYTIVYPSGTIYHPAIESATFLADFVYLGVACGTPEPGYSLTLASFEMATPSATFVSLGLNNVNISSNWLGLPGVFTFSLTATGINDTSLVKFGYTFEVEMICDL